MRGKDEVRGSLFSCVDLEQRIRPDHPLRMIRAFVNAALAYMSAEFDALYPPTGRDSIPPDHACGEGDAQLEDDGTLTGELRFHRGDESAFTARRW